MAISQFVGTVTFDDVINDDFTNQFAANQLDLARAAIAVGMSIVIGLLIYFVYKTTFKGVVYSASFAMSLVLMTVITTVIIVTISSNVVLSLGMVGALSIVRFRAAIKDPVDIMYLFWGIAAGIVTGAQQYYFAVGASLVIAVLCIVLNKVSGRANTYLLVVRYDSQAAPMIDSLVSQTGAKVRNQTAASGYMELTAELKENQIPERLIERLSSKSGVENAVLVNFNGEYCE